MKVNIVVVQDGWILERLARRLEAALPYVCITSDHRGDASINYYMSYALFNQKSKCDMVFFSHYDPKNETLLSKWELAVKSNVIGIVLEKKYKELLEKQGLKRVHLIKTGTDTSFFKPKTVIGVAGRTIYTPYRKGDDFVSQLITEMPDIDFRLAGVGGDKVFYLDMRNFYHGLDFFLSPERYGTSECIGEALACGIEVFARPFVELGDIKPPVHFYKTSEDIKKVVMEHHNRKMDKWWFVNDCFNAKGWVTEHDKLFQELGGGK